MNGFHIAALFCGAALYLVMLGASIRLMFALQDPDIMFGGACLTLILIGFPLAVMGSR